MTQKFLGIEEGVKIRYYVALNKDIEGYGAFK